MSGARVMTDSKGERRLTAASLVAGAFCLLLGCIAALPAYAARDAAFVTPGGLVGGSTRTEQAVVVEPKGEVDVGDTPMNVGRRATFFFVNLSNTTVEIESLTANGDSNVRADLVSDDCSREKVIASGSRCAVTVETTPKGAGSWTAEILMTHKAVGRIARARISGKTSSAATQEKTSMGLSLSTKDVKPVDFGDVEVGSGKAVRSALMINDSTEVITLQSIDVIAAENGLQKLEQGCLVDMDLKMGESCPVTLIWKPEHRSDLSTDLIIRHTGRLGFVVVPIRGIAKEVKSSDANKAASSGSTSASSEGMASSAAPRTGGGGGGAGLPPPMPTATEIERASAGAIPPLPSDALPASSGGEGGEGTASTPKAKKSGVYRLIGTVGTRAILYRQDGSTVTVGVGETIDDDDDSDGVKLVDVSPKQAEIYIDKKIKILPLEAASALTRRAAAQSRSSEESGVVASKKKTSKSPLSGGEGGAENVVPLPK